MIRFVDCGMKGCNSICYGKFSLQISKNMINQRRLLGSVGSYEKTMRKSQDKNQDSKIQRGKVHPFLK